jgi:hypothetical protein
LGANPSKHMENSKAGLVLISLCLSDAIADGAGGGEGGDGPAPYQDATVRITAFSSHGRHMGGDTSHALI